MDREEARLEATLEVDRRADTIVGTIIDANGVERRFSGWMELASAIEAWRTSAYAAGDTGDATLPRPPRPR